MLNKHDGFGPRDPTFVVRMILHIENQLKADCLRFKIFQYLDYGYFVGTLTGNVCVRWVRKERLESLWGPQVAERAAYTSMPGMWRYFDTSGNMAVNKRIIIELNADVLLLDPNSHVTNLVQALLCEMLVR